MREHPPDFSTATCPIIFTLSAWPRPKASSGNRPNWTETNCINLQRRSLLGPRIQIRHRGAGPTTDRILQ